MCQYLTHERIESDEELMEINECILKSFSHIIKITLKPHQEFNVCFKHLRNEVNAYRTPASVSLTKDYCFPFYGLLRHVVVYFQLNLFFGILKKAKMAAVNEVSW